MTKNEIEQSKTSKKSTLTNSSNKKASSKKLIKASNKGEGKQKSKSDINEDWYDYIDINLLLKAKSNNNQHYKVIEAASQDDLQLLQRVNKAFLKLNALNKPVVIPINLGDKRLDGQYKGSHWVGLVIKNESGALKAFYNDSTWYPNGSLFT